MVTTNFGNIDITSPTSSENQPGTAILRDASNYTFDQSVPRKALGSTTNVHGDTDDTGELSGEDKVIV